MGMPVVGNSGRILTCIRNVRERSPRSYEITVTAARTWLGLGLALGLTLLLTLILTLTLTLTLTLP